MGGIKRAEKLNRYSLQTSYSTSEMLTQRLSTSLADIAAFMEKVELEVCWTFISVSATPIDLFYEAWSGIRHHQGH